MSKVDAVGREITKQTIRSPFGQYMIARMQDAGILSFLELSRLSGLNRSHPPMLASGYCHPSPTSARRLADALNVEFDELWREVEVSRREWGRKRRSGELDKGFGVKMSFFTTADNADWLRLLARKSGKSNSKMVDSVITKARLADIKNGK